MEGAWDLLRQKLLQILDLLGRNRNWYSSKADQVNDPLSMEEFDAQPSRQFKARESVAGEERDIDGLTTITPVVEFVEQGKECLQAFLSELSVYFSFEAVAGLNRIPAGCLNVQG